MTIKTPLAKYTININDNGDNSPPAKLVECE